MSLPPNVQSVEWTLNDNLSVVQYDMSSREEIVMNYIKSLGDAMYNGMSLQKLNQKRAFGIGLDFGQEIDLNRNKIGLDFVSDVNNTAPQSLFMYFRSVISF